MYATNSAKGEKSVEVLLVIFPNGTKEQVGGILYICGETIWLLWACDVRLLRQLHNSSWADTSCFIRVLNSSDWPGQTRLASRRNKQQLAWALYKLVMTHRPSRNYSVFVSSEGS